MTTLAKTTISTTTGGKPDLDHKDDSVTDVKDNKVWKPKYVGWNFANAVAIVSFVVVPLLLCGCVIGCVYLKRFIAANSHHDHFTRVG